MEHNEEYRLRALCLRAHEMIRDLEKGIPLDLQERQELMEGLRGRTSPDYMHLYPQLIGEWLKEAEKGQ